MGNVVFNSSVFWKCSFFEELFKPVVENLNESDRIRGSKFMIMSLKAQINGLKFVMNRDYLILINIRLYKEVISKFISPSVSQYVIVALTRAGIVQSSKYLLELIITRREFHRKQNENREKMKEADLQKKLREMQKSTDAQLDERVAGKIDKTVPGTVMAILSTELTPGAF